MSSWNQWHNILFRFKIISNSGVVATGIRQIETTNRFRVIAADTGLVVRGADNCKVIVYATDGRTVNTGFSNTLIPLSERGIYIVSIGGENIRLKCTY